MFNIGAGEILLVLTVAFVIVGPDDLPKVARWLGRQVRRLRTLIRDIKTETGWDELEKEVRDIQKDVKDTAKEMDISSGLKRAAKEVKSEVESAAKGAESDLKKIGQDMSRQLEAADGEIRLVVNSTDDNMKSA